MLLRLGLIDDPADRVGAGYIAKLINPDFPGVGEPNPGQSRDFGRAALIANYPGRPWTFAATK